MDTTAVDPLTTRPRVVIAGAGIAGLEAALALRAIAAEDALAITMLAPDRELDYPPLSVLAPFTDVPGSGQLTRFARDTSVDLHHGFLASVDVERRVAITTEHDEVPFDALLIAIGARPDRWLDGAVPFRGTYDAPRIAELLDEHAPGGSLALAFVVPGSVSWSLPAYELALLAAARLRETPGTADVSVITHERQPLSAFGDANARTVSNLLVEAGVRVEVDARVLEVRGRSVLLADGRRVRADAVVALPVLRPRPVAGLPGWANDFIGTDDEGRVPGAPAIYAAGDGTAGEFKQGGLACQQADAAAAAIAGDLGFPCVAAPYRPVLRGVLVSDGPPRYLRRVLDPRDGAAPAEEHLSAVRRGSWPAAKVIGRHLGPYLARCAEGPGGPNAPLRLSTPR